eukprot:2602436-Amphidinium_carterae.2
MHLQYDSRGAPLGPVLYLVSLSMPSLRSALQLPFVAASHWLPERLQRTYQQFAVHDAGCRRTWLKASPSSSTHSLPPPSQMSRARRPKGGALERDSYVQQRENPQDDIASFTAQRVLSNDSNAEQEARSAFSDIFCLK